MDKAETGEEFPSSPRRALAEKLSMVIAPPNGMEQDAHNEIPEAPISTDAAVAAVAAVMDQEEEQQPPEDDATDDVPERPLKRRRGGRRVANPEVSAEERRRIRVLKNRESAMRSLAKKAEYSAKLIGLQKAAEEEHNLKRANLKNLVQTAIRIRDALEKITETDVSQLFNELSACIDRSASVTAPLPGEESQPMGIDYAPHPAVQSDGVGGDADAGATQLQSASVP